VAASQSTAGDAMIANGPASPMLMASLPTATATATATATRTQTVDRSPAPQPCQEVANDDSAGTHRAAQQQGSFATAASSIGNIVNSSNSGALTEDNTAVFRKIVNALEDASMPSAARIVEMVVAEHINTVSQLPHTAACNTHCHQHVESNSCLGSRWYSSERGGGGGGGRRGTLV